MKIPLIGLESQISSIQPELEEEVKKVIREGWFLLGRRLEELEREFARYCGVRFAIGVGSGTDALILALKAAGIGPGDEVLVPCNTFIATAEAVTHAGATPIFVDIDPKTFNIDVTSARVTAKTKAVIPVHLYGQAADMDRIKQFASEQNLIVIEDAAQAHGATYKGKKVGSIGDAGCFSFFPTKPLSALADAGMVTTNDDKIALTVRQLRNHGRAELNLHLMPGYTSRLDEIQAAVLLVKLKHLDEWNSQRKKVAQKYDELLDGLPLQTPFCLPSAEHVYYLYVVRVPRRDALRARLSELGVETSIHYPMPIHLQPAYQHSSLRVPQLKRGEAAAKEILSLPMFAELSDEELEYIAKGIRDFLAA